MRHTRFLTAAFALLSTLHGTTTDPEDSFARTNKKWNLPRISTDNPTMRHIDKIAPLYGLRPQFVRAISCRESSCGLILIAKETSKTWDRIITKRLKIPRHSTMYNRFMASYGALGISGLYAYLEADYAPGDLMDDEENIHYGAKLLSAHYRKCKGTVEQKEFCAAARHNGGPNGLHRPAALAYAEVVRAMIKIG